MIDAFALHDPFKEADASTQLTRCLRIAHHYSHIKTHCRHLPETHL